MSTELNIQNSGEPEGEPQDPGNVKVSEDGSEASISTEGAEQQAQQQGKGEGLILGKFKTQDDLANAYKELERKLGSSQSTDSNGNSTADGDEGGDLSISGQEGEAQASPEDLIAQALQEGGDLPYDQLQQAGISQTQADLMAQGIKAQNDNFRQTLFEAAGGEQEYRDTIRWAKDNLDPAEAQAYDEALTSGNSVLVRSLLRGIVAARQAARGQGEPNRMTGDSGNRGRGGPRPFRFQEEVTKAMQDERYASDPAFRQEVMERLAVSNL